MNCDLEKLNDFNMFEIMHNGLLYRATLRKGVFSSYPFELSVDCVDMDTGRHYPEFSQAYKTAKRALDRLAHYWKGETVEWKRI